MRVHNHASGRWEVGARIPGQAAVADVAWAPPLAREQEVVALCGDSQLSLWGLKGPATALEVRGPAFAIPLPFEAPLPALAVYAAGCVVMSYHLVGWRCMRHADVPSSDHVLRRYMRHAAVPEPPLDPG